MEVAGGGKRVVGGVILGLLLLLAFLWILLEWAVESPETFFVFWFLVGGVLIALGI